MTNPPTPAMRNLAQWLLDHEADAGNPSDVKVRAAFRTCEKLGHHLSKVAGVAGFWSLLSRALTLAKREAPWLAAVELKADGSLEGTGRIETQQDRDDAERGGVVLVAQLLGLLATFIGQNLAMRLVREVWPDAPLDLMDPRMEKEQ